MDIKQLEYYVQCARFQSFSKAANHFNVAQSAISRQIRNLERELGSVLILRNSRIFRLTEAGELFLQKAANVLQELHGVQEEVANYAGQPKGDLRLGVLSSMGELVMPQVVSAYRALYPDVQLHLRSGMSAFVSDWLNHDAVDIGVMHHPGNHPGLVVEPISFGQFVVVLPPKNTELGRMYSSDRPYSVHELADLPLVLTRTGHVQRKLIEREAAHHGYCLNVVIEADNVSLIIALVRKGIGASVLAYTSACASAWREDVRVAPLINPGIRTDISIVTRSDRAVTAAMRTMVSQIKSGMRDFILEHPIKSEFLHLAPGIGTRRGDEVNRPGFAGGSNS